ncbi:MAG: ABC transporter permease [Provencibacterium sp.]|jgi:lipopolysaccharide transport system permease protein|nr:ABC transporter permease [Provencibacterium sp.]
MKTLREIYAYRQMIISLVRRDLRGRYKGSVLGFLWTFINPLLQLCVYTILFSTILKSGIEKYYLFLFVALIPWLFFSNCLTGGAGAILGQKDMVKKIYFPREVIPIAYVTSSFVNMLLCFVVIFGVILFSGNGLSGEALLYLPLVMAVEYVMALGIALLTSAITVYFRDMEHILGIAGLAWMYLTPIMYGPDAVPPEFLRLFEMNPMMPVIMAYRDILYYKQPPQIDTLLRAFGLGLLVLLAGWLVFEALKKHFVEEL